MSTLNKLNWQSYGIDLPRMVPVLIDEATIDEDGRYLVVWTVMCVNNVLEENNILVMGQLFVNGVIMRHTGSNIPPANHYYSLSITKELKGLRAGDKIEIWATSDSYIPYPSGGVFVHNAVPYLRDFQLVKLP